VVIGPGRLCIERRPNRSGDAAAEVEVLTANGHHEHCICTERSMWKVLVLSEST